MGRLKDFFGDIAYTIKFEKDNRGLNKSCSSGSLGGFKLPTTTTLPTSTPTIMPKDEPPTREERLELEEKTKDVPILGDVVRVANRLQDTLENAVDAVNPIKIVERVIKDGEELNRGDHIITQRLGFTHHAIYIGTDSVIHYEQGIVKGDTIENFAKGSTVSTISESNSPTKYSVETIVSRAYSKIGEEKYNLGTNNCEHFARWCRNGD